MYVFRNVYMELIISKQTLYNKIGKDYIEHTEFKDYRKMVLHRRFLEG